VSPRKPRLDQTLVAQGLAPSRERARALILAGKVEVNGQRADKAGQGVPDGAVVTLRQPDHPYVSRGGLKLEGALEDLELDVSGMVVLDVGASTGGFTDCLLQRGARRVFGVDVGYGQVAYELRNDDRVTLFERTNFRHFDPGLLDERPDLCVADASFISLTRLLDRIKECLAPGGTLLAMVKPQFELDRKRIGKGGVVRDDALRAEAVERVRAAAEALGFRVLGQCDSQLPGPKGNREVFLYLELD